MPGILVTADSQLTDSGGALAFVDNSTYSAMAQKIVPTTSYTVHSLQLSIGKIGTPGGTIQAHIRADSGDNPGSSITNGSSNTVNPATLSTSTGFVEFTFTTPPVLTASTVYHIELTHSGTTYDLSNTVFWSYAGSNSYSAGVMQFKTSNAGAWLDDGSGNDLAWKLYKLVLEDAQVVWFL